MKEVNASTEERIREAARHLFLAKGYDGTTSRALAEAAGLNVAMTNYYFRSKEKLFKLTFADLQQKFLKKIYELVNLDIPLREKVLRMIDAEFEMVEENPELPMFVLYELQHHPQLFADLVHAKPAAKSRLFEQVEEAVAAGQIPAMQPVQLMMLILANVQHPYMARTFMSSALATDDAAFPALMVQHKQTVKDMLMTYLFGSAAQG